MSEIEVNEYVKIKGGFIGQVENINDYREPSMKYAIDIQKNDLIFVGEQDIVKHSKDIIDLIEVGDYVNGNEVVDKYLFNGEMPVLETTGNGTNDKCLCNSDIKTIVTHEQFSSIEYKV